VYRWPGRQGLTSVQKPSRILRDTRHQHVKKQMRPIHQSDVLTLAVSPLDQRQQSLDIAKIAAVIDSSMLPLARWLSCNTITPPVATPLVCLYRQTVPPRVQSKMPHDRLKCNNQTASAAALFTGSSANTVLCRIFRLISHKSTGGSISRFLGCRTDPAPAAHP